LYNNIISTFIEKKDFIYLFIEQLFIEENKLQINNITLLNFILLFYLHFQKEDEEENLTLLDYFPFNTPMFFSDDTS
jgi:hypothetical protein